MLLDLALLNRTLLLTFVRPLSIFPDELDREISFIKERRLVDKLSFLLAFNEDPPGVLAVCLEEHRSPPSLTVRVATNSGNFRHFKRYSYCTRLYSYIVFSFYCCICITQLWRFCDCTFRYPANTWIEVCVDCGVCISAIGNRRSLINLSEREIFESLGLGGISSRPHAFKILNSVIY